MAVWCENWCRHLPDRAWNIFRRTVRRAVSRTGWVERFYGCHTATSARFATRPPDPTVSPWIRRGCKVVIQVPQVVGAADYSHLRCTIDDEEDYQRVCRLFEDVAESVLIGWFELAKN